MIHRHESGMACSGTSSWGVFRDLQMCVHRKARDVKNIYCEIYDYSPASSSSLVTGTTLLSFFYGVLFSWSVARRPDGLSARLDHQLLTNLHLGSRGCCGKIATLMFYSCWTDQRDTKTPGSFWRRKLIDLQGRLTRVGSLGPVGFLDRS